LLRPELLEKIHIKVGSVEFELQKLQHDQEKRRNTSSRTKRTATPQEH
jgi:hypothetical protein